ncbi:MAG: hypothetical protein ACRYFZ_28430 [Janthinobacterium lividum]
MKTCFTSFQWLASASARPYSSHPATGPVPLCRACCYTQPLPYSGAAGSSPAAQR